LVFVRVMMIQPVAPKIVEICVETRVKIRSNLVLALITQHGLHLKNQEEEEEEEANESKHVRITEELVFVRVMMIQPVAPKIVEICVETRVKIRSNLVLALITQHGLHLINHVVVGEG